MAKNGNNASSIAIASLITGILGLSFIPIILGLIDLNRIKKGISGSDGKVLDVIGIVLGAFGLLALMIMVVASVIIFITFSIQNRSF